jgi:hypothetical protein
MVPAPPAALGTHPGTTPVTEGGGGAGWGKGPGFCGVEGVKRVRAGELTAEDTDAAERNGCLIETLNEARILEVQT